MSLIEDARARLSLATPPGWRWKLCIAGRRFALSISEVEIGLAESFGGSRLMPLGAERPPLANVLAEAGMRAAELALGPLLDSGAAVSARLGPQLTGSIPGVAIDVASAGINSISGMPRKKPLPASCPDAKIAYADWLEARGWAIIVGNNTRSLRSKRAAGMQSITVAAMDGWTIHARRATPAALGWQDEEQDGRSLINGKPRGYALPKDCPLEKRIWADLLASRGWTILVGARADQAKAKKWRGHEMVLLARGYKTPCWAIHACRLNEGEI